MVFDRLRGAVVDQDIDFLRGDIENADAYALRTIRRHSARQEDSGDMEFSLQTQFVLSLRFVPQISEFFGISIYMYWNDHQPAHFHAKYAVTMKCRYASRR